MTVFSARMRKYFALLSRVGSIDLFLGEVIRYSEYVVLLNVSSKRGLTGRK